MEKTIELTTKWNDIKQVTLEIGNYQNNNCMYMGLNVDGEEGKEPYGNITVNLGMKVPAYCGYVDLNNMPELAGFLEKQGIGESTGLSMQSGFCEYPLYLFDIDKLRELCPAGMEQYEKNIGISKEIKENVKSR